MMKKLNFLWEIVEDNSTKKGRLFDYSIQSLIFLSIISFSIETLPDLSNESKKILVLFEKVSITIFSIEYILRIIIAKSTFKYIFSFYGIIDLISWQIYDKFFVFQS